MEKKLTFSYAKTDAKKHVLEKKDGWYRVNLGGVNIFNEHNDFYLATGVKELLTSHGSRLYQKLKGGYLQGECEHPRRSPGMSKYDYFLRNIYIDPDRISHAIKEIDLVDSGIPAGKGFHGNQYWFIGWVKPMGKFGDYLRERLEEPECNCAFSIRSLTDDTRINGVTVKTIKNIITFDFVDEPGIRIANKWDTNTGGVSNESFGSGLITTGESAYTYTNEEIKQYENIAKSNSGVSTESIGVLSDISKSLVVDKSLQIFQW